MAAISAQTPEGPVVRSIRQITQPARMEIVSFLQPWFHEKKGGAAASAVERDLLIVIDGIGAPPATGVAGDVRIDFDTLIVGWTLLADQAGSIEVDIWRDTYTNFPPTVGDTITGGHPPFISSAAKNTDTVLAAWNPGINAGDCLRFNVDSVATIQRITLALHLQG